ncbi:hypothetical protein GOEFS_119_00040 [Gordonia effusa NBRC 100432]|uniref:GmrSD restriction endonucleases C-terminal domain-containing protein n=1 Tax=Gordonia effusa NBRC 100432 TaxID=1077974 RepID=H0R613_9ACTN|nr:HNH endonuclease family protein [Gordonia effusa]GAB20514.1 hypothetical protein GOEFS_119_00040 [Gordonia effusa NBRC 100432]
MTRRTALLIPVLLVLGLLTAACATLHADGGAPTANHLISTPKSSTSLSARPILTSTQTFRGLTVIDRLPEIPGYERSCKKGKKCVFGPAWTDDTDAPLSKNGCDTRNDLIRSQLVNVVTTARSHGCKVIAGTLHDPYTGKTIPLAKTASGSTIEVDHVIALERIWNLGADQWTARQRATVANDPKNLIATDASLNSSKGSKGLGEWLPPNVGFVCEYTHRYLAVAAAYKLPITSADRDAVISHHC